MASHPHHETAKEAKARHDHDDEEAAAVVAPLHAHAPSFDEIAAVAKTNPNCRECAARVFVGISDRFAEAVMFSKRDGATDTELAPVAMLVDQLRQSADFLAAAIVMNTPVAKG